MLGTIFLQCTNARKPHPYRTKCFRGRVVSALDYEAGDRVRFPVAAEISTDYSVLCGNLIGYSTVTSSIGRAADSCRTATLDIFSIWLNLKSQCFCALS